MHLCECEFCVFELTFVSLCLFVCKSFFMCVCVCVSKDAPSKSGPRQGVIHDFITQALHKALSNTPLFCLPLFASFPCSLSFRQLSSHCVSSALSAILPFSGRQCSPSLSFLSHLWIYTTFALISSWSSLILSPFSIFSLALDSCSRLVFLFCLLSVFTSCFPPPLSFSVSLSLKLCKSMN